MHEKIVVSSYFQYTIIILFFLDKYCLIVFLLFLVWYDSVKMNKHIAIRDPKIDTE